VKTAAAPTLDRIGRDTAVTSLSRVKVKLNLAGLPNKRELQKIRTRRELLRAGREVYMSRGLDAPTIEDVTKAAGVSRAAFYLHYVSREAHILAVFEREVRRQLRLYRSLTAKDAHSYDGILKWVRGFIARFRPERNVILITWRALSTDPRNLNLIYRMRRGVVLKLANRVPALKLLCEDGSIDKQRFIEMYAIFDEMESISLFSAFDAIDEDYDLVLANVARRIANLCGC
jgi:AcrR family transcriptional regulator